MSLFFETLREQLQMLVCALRFDPQAEFFDEEVIPQQEAHGDLTDNCLVAAVEKIGSSRYSCISQLRTIAVGSYTLFSL